MQLWYDDLIKRTHKRLEEERKEETARVERRKDRYIAELMRSHEKAFSEVKGYFNDITHNNLDRIKSLKEDVERKKGEEAADEKRMVEIALENKRMSEPLKQALEDVRRLREKLRVYEEEKEQLRSTKAELRVEEDKLQQIQWEHEVCARPEAVAIHAHTSPLYFPLLRSCSSATSGWRRRRRSWSRGSRRRCTRRSSGRASRTCSWSASCRRPRKRWSARTRS